MRFAFRKIIYLSAGIMLGNSARAVECDSINSVANLEGSLTFLPGYYLGSTGNIVLGPVIDSTGQGGVICQNGTLAMVTMNPAITSDVGDGQMKRIILPLFLNQAFSSRLIILAPTINADAVLDRELKFRDLELSNPENTTNAHLTFSLFTRPNVVGWFIKTKLKYIDSQGHEQVLALRDQAIPPQSGEINASYNFTNSGIIKSLRVTVGSISTNFLINANMLPLSQAQGLLKQVSIPQGLQFYIGSCTGSSTHPCRN